jgi:hypothetical protein
LRTIEPRGTHKVATFLGLVCPGHLKNSARHSPRKLDVGCVYVPLGNLPLLKLWRSAISEFHVDRFKLSNPYVAKARFVSQLHMEHPIILWVPA